MRHQSLSPMTIIYVLAEYRPCHKYMAPQVAQAFTSAFSAVETKWIDKVRATQGPGQRPMVIAGSCALYALVKNSKVYVANGTSPLLSMTRHA